MAQRNPEKIKKMAEGLKRLPSVASKSKPCAGNGSCNGSGECGDKGCKTCYIKICCGCGTPECCYDKSCGLPLEELSCKLSPAVVGINSQWILTTSGSETSGNALANRQDFFLNGSGSIIDFNRKDDCDNKTYILTTAGLVLAPPTVMSQRNRYPFVSGSVAPIVDNAGDTSANPLSNTMTVASRILVTISNLNFKCKTYMYEAKVEVVDGAGDIALLSISNNSYFNATACSPCIESCHPRFCIGKSRRTVPGSPVFAIGDYGSSPVDSQAVTGYRLFTSGVVSENRYVDTTGWYQGELLVSDIVAYAPKEGMPIINKHGHIVAIQAISTVANLPAIPLSISEVLNQAQGTGSVGGPSSKFFEHFLRVAADPCRYSCFLDLISDSNGPFYRYNKAYLGVAWESVTAQTLNTSLNTLTGARSVILDPITLLPTTLVSYKGVRGIQVTSLAGGNPLAYQYVAGANSGLVQPYAPVAYNGTSLPPLVAPGDIITSLGKYTVGSGYKQVSPGLFTWKYKSPQNIQGTYTDRIEVTVLSAANNWNGPAQKYSVSPIVYPYYMDYPWFTINNWPLVGLSPGNGYITNPQVPVLFKPAL